MGQQMAVTNKNPENLTLSMNNRIFCPSRNTAGEQYPVDVQRKKSKQRLNSFPRTACATLKKKTAEHLRYDSATKSNAFSEDIWGVS